MDSSHAVIVEARMKKAEEKLERLLVIQRQQEELGNRMKPLSQQIECLLREQSVRKSAGRDYHQRNPTMTDRGFTSK